MILNGFNLPKTKRSRFGEQLNAEKMKKAVWLRPEAVAQIEFLEWTEGDRLRDSTSRAVWRLQRFVKRPCALGAVGRYAWPSPTLRIQRIRIPEPASQPLLTAVPPGRAGPAR